MLQQPAKQILLEKSSHRHPLDCYANLVSVLCLVHPHKFLHFMAYQRTIIRAHQMFVGDWWVIHDVCYRRSDANAKLLDWGIKDNDLYNETFTGRAKAISCCISELYSATECPQGTHPNMPSSSYGGQFHTPRPDHAICLYIITGMGIGAHSRCASMATSAKNAGSGTQSLDVQNKGFHIPLWITDQGRRTIDSQWYWKD